MPCNTEYMEPTVKERQLQQAAQLLVFTKQRLGQKVTKALQAAADTTYGSPESERYVQELCDILRGMSVPYLDLIVYNGRDPMSRKLADWWEEHQKEDAKRIAADAAKLNTAAGAKAFFDDATKRRVPMDAAVQEFVRYNGQYYDDQESVNWFSLSDGLVIASGMNGIEIWKGVKL